MEAIEQDRGDAADLALHDASREGELARRDEAATARELSRTLRDFHLAEALADADEPEPEPAIQLTGEALVEPALERDPAGSGTTDSDRKSLPNHRFGQDLASFCGTTIVPVVAGRGAKAAANSAGREGGAGAEGTPDRVGSGR